jgi:predicted ATPase
VRLVTLSGPGGIGKTRLGLQAAAEMLDDFADGIYLINLAPLSDPLLVGPTIAQILGVTETGGQPLVEDLKTFLRVKQTLLVLDNFEQVLDAAPLVSQLLAAAPGLKALSTSRIVLKVRGEKEFPVPPLALPDPVRLPPLEVLSRYAAVELFIQRAVDVKSNFQVTNANAPAVAEICARLDGLPLAIELAAARIRLFPPAALLKRLERRLPLLTGGPLDLPARQRTLRATIDWSYNLLDVGEQTLFRRLTVFVSGCTLEAAEAVCKADSDLPLAVVDGLAALIDQSLLRQEDHPTGEPRFLMLETIREYALEQLESSMEGELLRREHATYYLALVEATEPQLWGGPGQDEGLARLEVEHDNLRAALAWSQTAVDGAEVGVRLAAVLCLFWHARGYHSEGLRWLEQALERSRGLPVTARAKALHMTGFLTQIYRADFPRAQALFEEGLALYRELGDKLGIVLSLNSLAEVVNLQGDLARATALFEESLGLSQELGKGYGSGALFGLGWIAMEQGDFARATPLLEEHLTMARESGNKRNIAWGLRPVGILAQRQGDLARASTLLEAALGLFQEVEDRHGQSAILNSLGEIAVAQRDFARAIARYEECLALCRELEHKTHTADVLGKLGEVWSAQGNSVQARASFAESLALFQEMDIRRGIASCLVGFAGVASVEGHVTRAVRLSGAAEALRDVIGARLEPDDRVQYERIVAATRTQLSEAVFAQAWAEGHAMTQAQVVAYALSEGD